MSTNPYSHPVGPGNFGQDFLEPVQQRLSVLAVMALVFGCICFVPGAGAIAIILGGSAAFFISRSNGRLRGMGLAIAGIVLGLLFTMLWIFAVMGIRQAMSMFTGQIVKPADTFMAAVEKSDFKTARAELTPDADKLVTDEMLTTFAADYKAEMGAYKGLPNTGIMDFFKAYSNVGPALNTIQGKTNWLPMPASFDKGFAVLAMEIDNTKPPNQTGNTIQLPMKNIGVVSNSGKSIWLIDPGTTFNIRGGIGGVTVTTSPGKTPTKPTDGTSGNDAGTPEKSPDAPKKP